MNKPITLKTATGHLTASAGRLLEIMDARASIKTPSVKQFRANALRKRDPRHYPHFVPGMTTVRYVKRYWELNSGAIGGTYADPDEIVETFYEQPLGTTPQELPLFDGVEIAPTAKKFDFPTACREMLIELGAVEADDYLHLPTIAGNLRLAPYDTWLATRFDDVNAAKSHIGFGQLNPFSGKWNWHFVKPTTGDVQFLKEQIKRVMVKP